MDIAIVTGAETPLGQRITERLLRMGVRVHGIANDFSRTHLNDPHFKTHAVDLTDLEAVRDTLGSIIESEASLDILIHAIDATPGTPFAQLAVGNVEAVLKIALMGPVMLTRMALPNLMRFNGHVIQLVPGNKQGCPQSALNALVEGGLRAFNQTLFDSARSGGVRATTIMICQNESTGEGEGAVADQRIDPDSVADTVAGLLAGDDPNIPCEIRLYPRAQAGGKALPATLEPIDPYRQINLPPKEQIPTETPIPTHPKKPVERTVPYTDEELEDRIADYIEQLDKNPERMDERAPAAESASKPGDGPGEGQGGGRKNRRRRGRRRGRRGRDSRDGQSSGAEPNQDARDARSDQREVDAGQGGDPSDRPQISGDRGERKPPHMGTADGDAKGPAPTAEPAEKPVKKTARKTATKKAATKKTVKKAVKKAAKKALKKVATKKTATKKTATKKTARKATKKTASAND